MADHASGDVNWSRRYRANLHRLNSGDRGQIAAVVDGLSQRDRDQGLSQGERRLLERARHLFQDPPGNGPAGVREPRSPLPPTGAGSVALATPQTPTESDSRADVAGATEVHVTRRCSS